MDYEHDLRQWEWQDALEGAARETPEERARAAVYDGDAWLGSDDETAELARESAAVQDRAAERAERLRRRRDRCGSHESQEDPPCKRRYRKKEQQKLEEVWDSLIEEINTKRRRGDVDGGDDVVVALVRKRGRRKR